MNTPTAVFLVRYFANGGPWLDLVYERPPDCPADDLMPLLIDELPQAIELLQRALNTSQK
jgi:hypothetical protein